MITKIQKKTINSLLDKYEKSKTFLGENQISQKFTIKITDLFPRYGDDAEYDYFCDVNDELNELQKLGLIILNFQRNNIIKTAELNLSNLEQCYIFAKRESKKDEYSRIIQVMEEFDGCDILNKYFDAQRLKISKNLKVEYYDGNIQDFTDLLKLVKLVCENCDTGEEQFIRDFSIKHFADSKRIESLVTKAQALMYQYGDFQEKDAVLEECGIVKTPTYVCIKGNGKITLGSQIIDLSQLKGDVALSTASLKELTGIEILGSRVITIENLTSFHDYNDLDDFVIYLGGFHNTTKRKFLMYLYEHAMDKKYFHFGDIDAGGFYIYEHLKNKTGIPFRTLYMSIEVLQKYSLQIKELKQNDRKRIESLMKKLDDKYKISCMNQVGDDYRNVLRYMLENNCKLEQEAVKIRHLHDINIKGS